MNMDSEKSLLEQQSIDFLAKFTNLVSGKQSNDVFELIFDSENEKLVIFTAMDLVTFLCNFLNNQNFDGEFFDVSTQILEYVIKMAKSKEILIAFIDFLNDEKIKNDVFFDLITKLLKITFLRLPDQQLDSLEFILCKFYDHVTRYECENDDYDQESFEVNVENDQELLLSENWPSAKMLHYEESLRSSLIFLEIFVSELKTCQILNFEVKNDKILILTSILLKFLSNPIVYFNLDEKIRSEKYFLAQKLINLIFDLHPNGIFKIIDFPMIKYDDFSLGLLTAYIYCNKLCQNRQPNVYSRDFIFRTSLSYCNALLQYDDEFFWRSGLKLCKFLLNFEQIDYIQDYKSISINLFKIMSNTRSKFRRQESYDVFWRFLAKFDPQVQIYIFRMVFYCMSTTKNCEFHVSTPIFYGIRGSIIDFYKRNLRIEFQNRQIFKKFLPDFLPLFCHFSLVDDILDQEEQIAACLNLLIFVYLTGDLFNNDQVDRYLENVKMAVDETKESTDCDLSLCKLNFLSSLCDRLSEIMN